MFFVLLLMLIQPVQARVSDLQIDDALVCMNATTKIEQQYQIKKHLLTTISSVETGRYDKSMKQTLAWPWTINAEGKGQFFETKADAIRETKRLLARGVKSIDVGCMQINLSYHSDAFENLEQAFDPETNVAYSAKFLSSLYETKKDWIKAAMAYHSSVPTRAQNYKKKLVSAYERVKLANNDFNTQLANNSTQVAAKKVEIKNAKIEIQTAVAEQKVAAAKATLHKAKLNAQAWREAKLAEYRKNKIK